MSGICYEAICSHVSCSMLPALVAYEFKVKSSGGSRRRAAGEPGCCTRARWGEEPRDRDLFISRRARVRSYILPLFLPPSSGSTCSQSLPTFLSFSTRLLAVAIPNGVVGRSARSDNENFFILVLYGVFLFFFT